MESLIDQKKIGGFVRELRREQGLTQEQLAERLGVTNRSVSRWENGQNLPDFDVVVEISHLFSVSLDEFFDGERRTDMENEIPTESAARKTADYLAMVQRRMKRVLCVMFCVAIAMFGLYAALELSGAPDDSFAGGVKGFALGVMLGMLLVGAVYTCPAMEKPLRKFALWKMKLLKKDR